MDVDKSDEDEEVEGEVEEEVTTMSHGKKIVHAKKSVKT